MILRTQNISKSYKNRTVVNGVSIELKKGEIVGLLGPNGAGKTTSFYMMVGLVKPDIGNVFLDELNITKTPMYKRSKMGIGYLPQEVSVFRKLSVEDNILAILQMTTLSKKEQKDRLEDLIEEFGLGHVRKNLGIKLSGGEKRRTEIKRRRTGIKKYLFAVPWARPFRWRRRAKSLTCKSRNLCKRPRLSYRNYRSTPSHSLILP